MRQAILSRLVDPLHTVSDAPSGRLQRPQETQVRRLSRARRQPPIKATPGRGRHACYLPPFRPTSRSFAPAPTLIWRGEPLIVFFWSGGCRHPPKDATGSSRANNEMRNPYSITTNQAAIAGLFTAPVSHQKRRERNTTNGSEVEQNYRKINEPIR